MATNLDLLVILPITRDQTERQAGRPRCHPDPSDHLRAPQASVEGVPLVSADCAFDAYRVDRLWEAGCGWGLVGLCGYSLNRRYLRPGRRDQ